MVAVRSSGRSSVIEPFAARPIGERAVATITASDICPPGWTLSANLREGQGDADRGCPRPPGPAKMSGVTRHTFLLKPRWSDLDAYNHVNNVTWLEYLQEARVDMLFVHAPEHGAEGLADGVLVVRAE